MAAKTTATWTVKNKVVSGSNYADLWDFTATSNVVQADNWTIAGGNGDDSIKGSAFGDIIWGDSLGNVNSSDNGSDTLDGAAGDDQIHGGNGKDLLLGGIGNDKLYGDNGVDTLDGGTGNDTLEGGNGGDVLIGGTGSDVFAYRSIIDSPAVAGTWTTAADTIADFQSGSDKLDLSALNSQLTGLGAPDKLTWGSGAAAYHVWTAGGIVYADTNGDGVADLAIKVSGVGPDDFIGLNHDPLAANDSNSGIEGQLAAITGNLATNDSDPDGDGLSYALVGTVAGLTVNANGTYSFDATNSAYDYLAKDVVEDIKATIKVSDGHGGVAYETLTISLTGTNDAAVITGDTSGDATEAGVTAGSAASGDLNSTDVDNTNDLWTVSSGLGDGKYGSYAIGADGKWTYTVDDTNDAVQALNANGTLEDTFTVATIDGTTQQVTVTIHGTNDAAEIGGDIIGDATEAGVVAGSAASGDLNSTDVDNTDDLWTADSGLGDAKYGSYAIDADGKWTYTVDDTNDMVQSLNSGDTLEDTFTVATVDGTTQQVTVTIHGANDAAAISGTVTGSVTEDALVDFVSGTLTATDVDNPANTFQAVAAGAATANGYGTFAMTADGTWTFTLDNANPAVNALNNGEPLSDSFTVYSQDGTAQLIEITINGHTDCTGYAPVDVAFTLDTSIKSVAKGGTLTDGSAIGTFSAVDPDSSTWTYSLGGTNAASFSLDASTGVLVANGSLAQKTAYSFTITATDAEGHAGAAEAFTVYVGANSNAGDTLVVSAAATGIAYGLNGSDALTGGDGDDALAGGGDSDALAGGLGHDQLFGGDGADKFVFSAFGAANADTVLDFNASNTTSGNSADFGDQIRLDHTVFTQVSLGALPAANFVANAAGAAVQADDYIVYNTATHQLFYDADGSGAGGAQLIATLTITAGTFDQGDILVI